MYRRVAPLRIDRRVIVRSPSDDRHAEDDKERHCDPADQHQLQGEDAESKGERRQRRRLRDRPGLPDVEADLRCRMEPPHAEHDGPDGQRQREHRELDAERIDGTQQGREREVAEQVGGEEGEGHGGHVAEPNRHANESSSFTNHGG